MLQHLLKKTNFATKLSHLNDFGQKLIPMDPNFKSIEYTDFNYRQRRLNIGKMSIGHKMGALIRQVDYTQEEHQTWRIALEKLNFYQQNVMSSTYLKNMRELQQTLNFSASIPKINDLSSYLKKKTGFQIKPVGGMIDQRQFLNCLAFKVFCSGQFIRHSQCIDFTTEPDIIHEYVGHVPMFADPHIADFSQKIGLLSLGASDEDIQKLGRAYLYTIELGLCLQDSRQKIFGAGIAACAADLKKVSKNTYNWKEFEPEIDCKTDVESFQKPFEYFYLYKSIEAATQHLLKIGKNVKKPFICEYDKQKEQILVLSKQ